MIIRVRTRDGTEQVTVEEGATVKQLRQLLEAQFKVPYADQTVSLDQKLVRSPDACAEMFRETYFL